MATWKKDGKRWNLVDDGGEVLGWITKYTWGSGWTVRVTGVPNTMQGDGYTEVRQLLYPKLARSKKDAERIIVAVRAGRDAWATRREKNQPSDPTSDTLITLRVPNSFFDEVWALEVDTWEGVESAGGESPWTLGRQAFVKAWEDAKGTKRHHTVKLTKQAAEYMTARNGAIDNSTDIWSSGFEGPARVRAWEKTADRLKAEVNVALGRDPKAPPEGNPVTSVQFESIWVTEGGQQKREIQIVRGSDKADAMETAAKLADAEIRKGRLVVWKGTGYQRATWEERDGTVRRIKVRYPHYGTKEQTRENFYKGPWPWAEYLRKKPARKKRPKKNPTPDEMLAEHAETWKEVEWLGAEDMDGDGAYDFSVALPCPPRGKTVTVRQVGASVRRLFAQEVLESADQLTLPKIRTRKRTPPPVDIDVEYGDGEEEAYLNLSFPPDLSGPRVVEMVRLLDALDKNVETLCVKRKSARAANPGAPLTATALVGRLKF